MTTKMHAVIRGEAVATVGGRFVLVKTGTRSKATTLAEKPADLLVAAGRALAKPGIKRSSVFGNSDKVVYAYSIDPEDPTRFIREAADGTRRVGKMINGKFKLLRTA